MVVDIVIGAGAALAGSVVQTLISRQNTKDIIDAENDRRLADLYLENKVDVLTEFNSKLWEARDWIAVSLVAANVRGFEDNGEIMIDERGMEIVNVQTDLYPLIRDFQRLHSEASLYLDEDINDEIADCVGEFWEALAKLSNQDGILEGDIDNIIKVTENIRESLQKEISGPIERIEKGELEVNS